MGLGDVLMAAGLVEELYATNPAAGPVRIVDLAGQTRWHYLWDTNPAISPRGQRSITCGGGCLPYLVYPRPDDRLIFSSTYRARDHRGSLFLTDDDRDHARAVRAAIGPYVVIEPHGRDRKNVNRQWPLARWQSVADQLRARGMTVVQSVHEQSNWLNGVHHEPTANFRDACALFAHADLVIAPEGGVPFGCAAVGQSRCLVLWGGCVSFDTLHYPEQINLVDADDQSPCGSLWPCAHCVRVWHDLTVSRVVDVALTALAAEVVHVAR